MATHYEWVPVARSGERFASFAPYVASIDPGGVVAFQATLAGGGSGVFTAERDGAIAAIATTEETGGDLAFAHFDSHPDLDASGALSFYAELSSGERGVFVARDGRVATLAGTAGGGFADIGPLGPTMNDAGAVAFRATTAGGAHGVFTAAAGREPTRVAGAGDGFTGFEGLPVVTGDGAVVFRAAGGIHRWRGGEVETVAAIGDRFRALGRFPSANDAAQVAFAGELTDRTEGVFVAGGGAIANVVDSRRGFESFRGALLDRDGVAVFYATPRGGTLGLYTGPDPVADRALGAGDRLLGSTVAGFALNPVSINERGQLAVRVAYADGTEAIVRGDPRD